MNKDAQAQRDAAAVAGGAAIGALIGPEGVVIGAIAGWLFAKATE